MKWVTRGLEAIAEGFRLIYHDDHEQVEWEFPVYEALYAYCRQELRKEHLADG